jgi:pilus assembly protein CpaB
LGVAGFVLPGDRVDVMLTRNMKEGRVTDILLQNVKVLAIDQISDDRKDDAKVSNTVTFEVDTVDAQKLALATGIGILSLALRSAGSVDAAQPRRVTLGDLNPAAEIYSEDDGQGGAKMPTEIDQRFKAVENQIKSVSDLILQANKRKIGDDGDLAKPVLPIVDPNARVGIIRGTTREEYSVPRDDAR